MVSAYANAGAVESTYPVRRVGSAQLPHGGSLSHGHVIQHAERADDDAGEQQALEVHLLLADLQECGFLRTHPREDRDLDEEQRQQPGKKEARQGAEHSRRGGRVQPMREVEGQEHDGGAPDYGDHQRIAPCEDRRQHELDEDDK